MPKLRLIALKKGITAHLVPHREIITIELSGIDDEERPFMVELTEEMIYNSKNLFAPIVEV